MKNNALFSIKSKSGNASNLGKTQLFVSCIYSFIFVQKRSIFKNRIFLLVILSHFCEYPLQFKYWKNSAKVFVHIQSRMIPYVGVALCTVYIVSAAIHNLLNCFCTLNNARRDREYL